MDAFCDDLRRQGREEALAVLREAIADYRMLKDFAPDKAVNLYAHGILSVLERVAETIKRL